MVKGISRQAVVVRSPESGAFEQAIFLLSEDRSGAALHSPEELLALADKLAADGAAALTGPEKRAFFRRKKPRSSRPEKRGSLFVILLLKITLRNRLSGR